ncbi:MAG: transporter related [Bryobacterales bacterium]|nr:transporter related [Bryobacterales bacterium]
MRALKSVSFDLQAGEVHALVGENGAGKSTLIKVLTGAVQADAGTILLDGETITGNSPQHSRSLGIAAVYQQPAIFPHLTVAENIALVNEPGRAAARVDWKTRLNTARELLKAVGAEIDPSREAGTLSMPEQQLVEIAKALGANVRVLILDEPTASLTEVETERLLGIVARLRGQGAGIIYISHRLDELSRIADRITVLRDGESVATRAAAETTSKQLISLMVGREMASVFPKRSVALGAPVLKVDRLVCGSADLQSATFEVRAGEILGIAGLVGSGRTQLAETLFGITPPDSGSVSVNGTAIYIKNPQQAIEAGLAYVPEDRRRHGIVGDLPVRANTTLAILDKLGNTTLLDQAAERTLASDWVTRLGIKTDGIDAPANSLSGGNQQKVAIARWLATNPKVLILDEPTQGIDVGAKAECHRIMCDLAERGLAIVMISSELAEVLGMSDRIAVMRKGEMVATIDRADATPDLILSHALGHGGPA